MACTGHVAVPQQKPHVNHHADLPWRSHPCTLLYEHAAAADHVAVAAAATAAVKSLCASSR